MYDLRTSFEWSLTDYNTIYDPDGWDRQNFVYSFMEEKITYDEYIRRRANSTLKFSNVAPTIVDLCCRILKYVERYQPSSLTQIHQLFESRKSS